MTPPVRRRSLEEIFGGRAPEPADDERERPSRLSGLGGALAQGALAGTGNAIMAGAGTAVRKLQGDDRPLSDIYRQLKDDVDTQEQEYARTYPGTNLAANVAGGLASVVGPGLLSSGLARTGAVTQASGPMADAARAGAAGMLNRVTPFSGAGFAGRAGNAAAQGALAGGVAGGVNAETLGEVPERAARGAAFGGVAGAGFSLFGDALKQGARFIGAGPQSADGSARAGGIVRRLVGKARDAVGAETAEEAGARRTIRLLDKTRGGLDAVADEVNRAAPDDPTMLFERAGNKGAQRLRTFRDIGNTARDEVDETLYDRAMNETARLRERFSALTGVDEQDAVTVARQEMERVKPITDALYKRTESVPLRPQEVITLGRIVGDLEQTRIPVIAGARQAGGPTVPLDFVDAGGNPVPWTVGQAQHVRQSIDKLVSQLQGEGQSSIENLALGRLQTAREQVDAIVKAGGGNPAAAIAVQTADELFATAKGLGESFGGGIRAAQSGNVPMARRIMGEQPNPEMARRGVGSDVLRRLGRVVNEGGTQNPGPRVTGGQTQRDITRMAFPDDQTFGTLRDEARGITRRLANMRTATAGSQTSSNLIDAMGEFVDPQTIASAMTGNPAGTLQKLVNMGIVRRVFDANATEADAAVKYLLAGGTDQMTEREAIAALQALKPVIQRRAARQATSAALAGQGAANAVLPSPIRRRER